MKILVCDDIARRGAKTCSDIEAATGHQVELTAGQPLKEAIEGLVDHVRYVMKGTKASQAAKGDGASVFRQPFDMVILDNNLSDLRIAGARHTAESIAGYARAFGKIPYIVSLNKNPHVDFDLRHLVGDHQTLADIAVNDTHLKNPGLWTGKPQDATDGFLPWYWPTLNEAPNRRRKQIRCVAASLDQGVLASMQFPRSATTYLSRRARGALSPDAARVQSVTFRKFFLTACRSLPNLADRRRLAKAASADERACDGVSQIVAGEMERWIRRNLLGPQDCLVDLPHLLMRMPFLLGRRASELQSWNRAVVTRESPYGLSDGIYTNHLRETSAEGIQDLWTEGPCFWWRDLKDDIELNRMFYRAETPWIDTVFCEDSSRFVCVSEDADKPAAMEFSAEFEGSWNRRHIEYLPRKQYAPKSRLAK